MSLFQLFVAVLFTISFHPADSVGDGSPALKQPIFNYSDTSVWGSLLPSFAACSIGKKQSPVDIITKETINSPELGQLEKVTRPMNATLKIDAASVEIEMVPLEENTTLTIHGKTFILIRAHWHTPSEHNLNGFSFAAEQHQVYQSLEGRHRAVVGVLYKYGQPDPLISKIEPYLKKQSMSHCGGNVKLIPLGNLNSRLIEHETKYYYRYFGSLTTPPCDECVTWTIISEVKTISKDQLGALKAPLCCRNKQNARPVQPLNGRKVQFHASN